MFKKKTLHSIVICSLALVLFAIPCMISFNNSKHVSTETLQVRTTAVEISEQTIDYESVLNEFEDSKLETVESLTTFVGCKTLNLADFEELDNLSETNIEENFSMLVKYNFSYDSETNLVTLSAESINELGQIEIDEIYGAAFINENGNIDAILDVDGEFILLSEMQDAGMIQNCGWFKRLFKKVVVAAVAVIAVAAVAATVVATCGAGLGACIAAGAIAGAVTGGIAGGVISYSEYGKLKWQWVVGGAVFGAALGAVTGWGVGAAANKIALSKAVKSYLAKDLKFSKTVLGHTNRPYRNSQLLAKEIMKAGKPVADPGGIVGGLKWKVAGSFNGTLGKWELVYDTVKNTIVHFCFVT